MILGFGWGGWMTTGSAERIARERSQTAATAALVSVCVEKSKADPARAKKLGALKLLTSPYAQRDAVLNGGWATVDGGEGNREVAELCATHLLQLVSN